MSLCHLAWGLPTAHRVTPQLHPVASSSCSHPRTLASKNTSHLSLPEAPAAASPIAGLHLLSPAWNRVPQGLVWLACPRHSSLTPNLPLQRGHSRPGDLNSPSSNPWPSLSHWSLCIICPPWSLNDKLWGTGPGCLVHCVSDTEQALIVEF